MRLALLLLFWLGCSGVSSASEVLDRVQDSLKKSGYRDSMGKRAESSLEISGKLRAYTVHSANMTGEWSKEAHEAQGPDTGGYRFSIYLIRGSKNTEQWAGRHPLLEFREGDWAGSPYWIDSGCGAYLKKTDSIIHINWNYNGTEGKEHVVRLLSLIKASLEPFDVRPLP